MTAKALHPVEALSALVDGELDEAERSAVQVHLAACPSCPRLLEDLRRIADGVKRQAVPPVPDGLRARVIERLHEEQGGGSVPGRDRRPGPRRWAIAAGIAAVMVLGSLTALESWRFLAPALRSGDEPTVAPADRELAAKQKSTEGVRVNAAPPALESQALSAEAAVAGAAKPNTPAGADRIASSTASAATGGKAGGLLQAPAAPERRTDAPAPDELKSLGYVGSGQTVREEEEGQAKKEDARTQRSGDFAPAPPSGPAAAAPVQSVGAPAPRTHANAQAAAGVAASRERDALAKHAEPPPLGRAAEAAPVTQQNEAVQDWVLSEPVAAARPAETEAGGRPAPKASADSRQTRAEPFADAAVRSKTALPCPSVTSLWAGPRTLERTDPAAEQARIGAWVNGHGGRLLRSASTPALWRAEVPTAEAAALGRLLGASGDDLYASSAAGEGSIGTACVSAEFWIVPPQPRPAPE